MSRRRLIRTIAGGAGALFLSAGFLVAGGSPAAATGTCTNVTNLPTLNTWYDGNGNYQGTYRAYAENGYGHKTRVYDTYGPHFRQVEMWDEFDSMVPRLVSCVRKPHTPEPEPEEPQISGGGGRGATHVSFPRIGVGFSIHGGTGRKGTVTVGDAEQVE